MSGEEAKDPRLDWSRIVFPSDAITVAAVRTAESTRGGFDEWRENLFANLEALVITERDLAQKAFDATLQGLKPSRIGKRDHESAWDRREMISGMDSEYQLYGLSSGPKQSAQLARQIEAQASEQARELMGKSR